MGQEHWEIFQKEETELGGDWECLDEEEDWGYQDDEEDWEECLDEEGELECLDGEAVWERWNATKQEHWEIFQKEKAELGGVWVCLDEERENYDFRVLFPKKGYSVRWECHCKCLTEDQPPFSAKQIRCTASHSIEGLDLTIAYRTEPGNTLELVAVTWNIFWRRGYELLPRYFWFFPERFFSRTIFFWNIGKTSLKMTGIFGKCLIKPGEAWRVYVGGGR